MATTISLHDRVETKTLLGYCFQHKMITAAKTMSGKPVEVLDPGLRNRHEGPDFFNAKIMIGKMLWVCNVVILGKSSEWIKNGYDKNRNYNNTYLVICGEFDSFIQNSEGETINVVCQEIPEKVRSNYQDLLANAGYEHPACYRVIPDLSPLKVHAWLAAMQTERLENKTAHIKDIYADTKSWDKAFFMTLARSFGFGYNGDVFEKWAESLPLDSINRHRDDLFQVEAFFLGQAGLLELSTIPEKFQEKALNEGYFAKLRNEYLYLQHKYSLQPINGSEWNMKGLTPQNYPHIRISQMANLYYTYKAEVKAIINCENIKEVENQLHTHATPYWFTHYTFGAMEKDRKEKNLSPTSINSLMINAVVPFLFTYGRYAHKEILCDNAFDYLEQLKAENNAVTKQWERVGIKVKSAGDSQALIQMKHHYCNKRDCLRCRFGHEYITQN